MLREGEGAIGGQDKLWTGPILGSTQALAEKPSCRDDQNHFKVVASGFRTGQG